MKTTKSLIIFSALLMMASIIVNLYFLLDSTNLNKNIGAYVGVGAMLVLLIALITISFSERKLHKLEKKIDEQNQEIGRLQKSLEQSNEVISMVPLSDEDVKM